MKAIIIAAGLSKRLRPLTNDKPKCMLEVNEKPIIQNTIELFKNNGIEDISVIRGYKKEKINFPGITYFENTDFENNNILHSLMYARKKLEEAIKTGEEVLITYSDIWFEDKVVKSLLKSKQDISLIVDTEWEDYYNGRTQHPISEAENVVLNGDMAIKKIGKDVFSQNIEKNKQGEFIGLWKFTSNGIMKFLRCFDSLHSSLNPQDPFQNAKEWQKSYMTDIFQEMADRGENIYAVLIQKSWMEFDTVQDYERLVKK